MGRSLAADFDTMRTCPARRLASHRNYMPRCAVMIVEVNEVRLAILLLPLLAVELVACGGGDSANEYDVSVQFNETVEQDDMDEVDDLLRGYDSDAKVRILESFPPQLRATLKTDVPDFCATVQGELAGLSYVSEVTCE